MTKIIICKDVFGNEYPAPVDQLKQRLSANALIIRDGKILLTRQWDGYSLVGGGVEKGESLEQAVIREAKEETGLEIVPAKLLYQTVVYFQKDADSQPYQCFMFYFACDEITGDINHEQITDNEKGYTYDAPEWVLLSKIDTIKFRHSVPLQEILAANPI